MTPAPPVKKFRIGDALVNGGVITNEQLTRALAAQKSSGQLLGQGTGRSGRDHRTHSCTSTFNLPGCDRRSSSSRVNRPGGSKIGRRRRSRTIARPSLFKVRDTLTVAMRNLNLCQLSIGFGN